MPEPQPSPAARGVLAALALVTLAGIGALVAAMVPAGPGWLGAAGATAITTTFTMALAARTGGRPYVFGALALAVCLAAAVTEIDELRTASAILSCSISAVLAVMATVPAPSLLAVVRECVVAIVIGGVGALATVGFEPAISLTRFEYAVLALSLAGVLALVFRLGAGFHGLGRRGLVTVFAGAGILAVTLLYAELLRRYGTAGLVETLLDGVRWSRDTLGAFPRPIEAVLGVPALAWGVHMRARRRQGWWVCAFGVAATSAASNALANPAISVTESGLSVLYGLVVGLLIGALLIRVDLFLFPSPVVSGGGGGRRRRGADPHGYGMRPEPARTQPLL